MKALAPNSFSSSVVSEVKESPALVIIIALFTVLSFVTIPLLNAEWALRLSAEDGFYEYLTAFFFLVGSLIFLRVFFRKRIVWFLLLSLLLFMGFGEEISWGQRIIGFSTPDFVEKVNVQHEFTIHNLEPVNPIGLDGVWKNDWRKIFTITNLFTATCFIYGIALPLGVMYLGPVRAITQKTRIPIPPFSLGIFFLLSYLSLRIVLIFTLPKELFPWRDAGEEISECCTSLVWLVISVYFLKTKRKLNALPGDHSTVTKEPAVSA